MAPFLLENFAMTSASPFSHELKLLRLNSAFILLIVFGSSANAASLASVDIKSNLDPNAITITEIDIVFLYDQALLEDFPATKSRWYSMRRSLTQRWGDSMDVVSVFIPQGFDSDKAILPDRGLDAVKVYVFGQHDEGSVMPVDVTDFSSVLVTIDGLGIIVTGGV